MILITNLGKAKKQDNNRYRETTYLFEDGREYKTQLFSSALLKWLGKDIDKIVMLGTKTSMWDSLLEFDFEKDNVNNEDLSFAEELYNKVNNNNGEGISKDDLSKLSKRLSELTGIEFICLEIPFGLNDQEQNEILKIISKEISEQSEIYFDFTHGLRHIPFFATLAIFYLKQVKNVKIKGIYYGALELTSSETKKTPVISMKNALKTIDWINAITIAEKTGNYLMISELVNNESLKENLEKLTFFRNTNQIDKMKPIAKHIKQELNQGTIPKEMELYKEKLVEDFAWLLKDHFALRQLDIAKQALENNNYTQAAILAVESLISAYIKKDPANYENRKNAEENIKNKKDKRYSNLKAIRNSCVHGTHSQKKEIQTILSDSKKLTETMKDHFKEIENKINTIKGKNNK